MLKKVKISLLFAATVFLVMNGCSSEDDPVAPPATSIGNVVIDATPDSLYASWVLSGPDGYTHSGNGDLTLEDMEAGDYTVTWGLVTDWLNPDPSTQNLVFEGTVSFVGTYLPDDGKGKITILPSPEVIDAPWSISGPGNYSNNGNGEATLEEMSVGSYTLTWGTVTDYIVPLVSIQALAAEDSLAFTGLYVLDPGPASDSVLIPPESVTMPATFTMGSTFQSSEAPHEVTLSSRFNMASTEVTNAQYVAALQFAFDHDPQLITASISSVVDNVGGSSVALLDMDDPDCQISFSGGTFSTSDPDRPVVEVSWYGAAAYCDWLNVQDGLGMGYDHDNWSFNHGDPYGAPGYYRLPTEAEWELACRANSETHFNTGDCLSAETEANYNGTIEFYDCPIGPNLGRSADVGSYPANDWDLQDMHGNVFEWCNDWYGSYSGDETDPVGSDPGTLRVIRGGDWSKGSLACRSAYRGYSSPAFSYGLGGFRTVRTPN